MRRRQVWAVASSPTPVMVESLPGEAGMLIDVSGDDALPEKRKPGWPKGKKRK